jgi:hypothetical protein
MKKILVIHFAVMANAEHYQFVYVFKTMVDGCEVTKALLAAELLTLDQLLELEQTAIDAPLGSPVTAQIKVADKKLDKLLGLTFTAVDAAKYSSNPVQVQAAEALLFALKPYRHIKGTKFEAEIGNVKSLLQDLRGKYLPQATTVGIVQWLDPIQEAVATEEALFAQRNVENAQRAQQKKAKDIRPEVDALVHRMAERVEVAAATDSTGAYDKFIAELNEKIRSENLRHQPHKMDIGEATVVEISAQPFAGKAVTPIPTVRYTNSKGESLELTFAKDFTVKYKNNAGVGNASLVIHGCGEYGGRKTVTFNIV